MEDLSQIIAPEDIWADLGEVEMISGSREDRRELEDYIMKTRRLLLAIPLLAAVMVAFLHPWTTVQARPSFLLPPNSNPWPPVDPADIVNVRFDQVMTGGQFVTVFTVPSKRHLIVTDVGLVSDSSGFDFQLLQRTRKGSTVKLLSQFTASSALGIGLVFEPGSSVDVVNTRLIADHVSLTLFGYLEPSKDWPPIKPADIFDNAGAARLAYGGTFKICDVPADRWLVITSDAISGTGNFSLLEDLAGTQTVKPLLLANSQLVGIAFQPGSSVLLRNDEPFSDFTFHWLLTGYLAR